MIDSINRTDTRAIFRIDIGLLCRDYFTAHTKLLIWDPSRFGLPGILTVAHIDKWLQLCRDSSSFGAYVASQSLVICGYFFQEWSTLRHAGLFFGYLALMDTVGDLILHDFAYQKS